MDERWKPILIGTAGVLFVMLAAFGIYSAFFRRVAVVPIPTANTPGIPPTPGGGLAPATGGVTPSTGGFPVPNGGIAPTPTPTAAGPSVTLPVVAQGGATQTPVVADVRARFSRIGPSGNLTYYDPSTRRFYRVGPDGKPVELSAQEFPLVQSAAWAPNANRAILEFPDGANVFVDFDTKEQVTLPAHWQNFSFAPNGDRITGLSIGLDRENRFLFEAEPNGQGFRPLESLGENADRVQVAWSPNNQVVAFSRTGSDIGGGRQNILLIGRNGENFPSLVVEGTDFRPQWSPTGSAILYSAVSNTNDYKPELWVVNGSGNQIGSGRHRLHVNTWADKCAFADEATLFCAVPDDLPEGAGLEPRAVAQTPDSIVRIDLTTGARTTIGRPENPTNITSVTPSPDGSRVYFTARTDGRIREMRIQ